VLQRLRSLRLFVFTPTALTWAHALVEQGKRVVFWSPEHSKESLCGYFELHPTLEGKGSFEATNSRQETQSALRWNREGLGAENIVLIVDGIDFLWETPADIKTSEVWCVRLSHKHMVIGTAQVGFKHFKKLRHRYATGKTTLFRHGEHSDLDREASVVTGGFLAGSNLRLEYIKHREAAPENTWHPVEDLTPSSPTSRPTWRILPAAEAV